MEITEQSSQTAADPLPEISELSMEQVTEDSSPINSKEQNLQPEVNTTANQTQQDEQKVQITGNLPMSQFFKQIVVPTFELGTRDDL